MPRFAHFFDLGVCGGAARAPDGGGSRRWVGRLRPRRRGDLGSHRSRAAATCLARLGLELTAGNGPLKKQNQERNDSASS
jgi:hypothetical protein